MGDPEGKVALVTGASRGIGKAIAIALGQRGVSIAACARGDHAHEVVDTITSSGGTAVSLSVDVTDADAVRQVVRDTLDRFGRLDVLVNNAGVVKDQLLLRMKSDEWDTVLATNLTAAFVCTQAALRTMLKQRWGRIISISSVVGQSGNPGQTNYAASKAGLIGFSKSLAREVASRGVTVNVVAPGFIETDMTARLDPDAREALTGQIPAGRLGTPEDVAGVVSFLASDEASYITGQVVGVNGGMYM